jgi:hypothetical protein
MILAGVVAGSGIVAVVAPSAPTSFSATPSTTSVSLSWSAPSNNGGGAITSYTLKRGATTIYTGAGTSFSDTGLSAGTGYSYTVLATNSAGDGPTAAVSTTTLATVPSAPTSFSASAASSSSINLSWGAPSSNGGAAVTSYTLKRGATTIYSGGGTSFTDTGLSPATGYSYTVLANNSAGAGATASASATTSAAVPNAPSISLTYNFTELGQDEEGNSNGIYYNFYTLNISHGSNNGSAVTSTQVQASGDNANWAFYGEPLYPPNNNSFQYIVIQQYYYTYVRAYDINGVGAGAASSSVIAYG